MDHLITGFDPAREAPLELLGIAIISPELAGIPNRSLIRLDRLLDRLGGRLSGLSVIMTFTCP